MAKRIITVLLVALIVCVSQIASTFAADGTHTFKNFGETYSERTFLDDPGTYPRLLGRDYDVTIPKTGKLEIEVTSTDTPIILDVYLEDANQNRIHSWWKGAKTQTLSFKQTSKTLEKGKYKIWITYNLDSDKNLDYFGLDYPGKKYFDFKIKYRDLTAAEKEANNKPVVKPIKVVAPTGKPIIRNTIANSAKKTNDVIWDKSPVKGASHYELAWRKPGASKWNSKTYGNTIRGTNNNLTIGALYEIRVRPKKIVKSGNTTKTANGTWSNTVYRYFHTTQKIRLKSASKGTFTMSWQKNPAATSYQVMYTTNSNGAGAANNIKTVGASATSYTQKGLKSGVTYYVQVREIRTVNGINYIGNISCPVAVKVK